jgi:hypothetical protein
VQVLQIFLSNNMVRVNSSSMELKITGGGDGRTARSIQHGRSASCITCRRHRMVIICYMRKAVTSRLTSGVNCRTTWSVRALLCAHLPLMTTRASTTFLPPAQALVVVKQASVFATLSTTFRSTTSICPPPVQFLY